MSSCKTLETDVNAPSYFLSCLCLIEINEIIRTSVRNQPVPYFTLCAKYFILSIFILDSQ